MRNGNLFWGAVLILVGVLMAFGAMRFFWPILLIAFGLWLVAGAYLRKGSSGKTNPVAVDLQGAREMSVRIGHGAGQLRVGAGASAGKALEGECTDNVRVTSHLAGDRLEVRVGGEVVIAPIVWNPRGLDWNLRLSNEVPFSLDLETGANQSTVNLRDLRVTSVKLKTGASSTDLTLPAAGVLTAEIQMGAAEVTIHVPQGVAARIRSQSGLAEINVDTTRFPRGNGMYESPDFGSSPNRVDMTVEAGVGKVSII
jgi:hypothetical protein